MDWKLNGEIERDIKRWRRDDDTHTGAHSLSQFSNTNRHLKLLAMATAMRIRSSFSLLRKALPSDSQTQRSNLQRALLDPNFQRNYATSSPAKKESVKVPIAMFGGSGNYASALYLAAVKANALDKVESELYDLVEASKKSPTFFQFTKDLSVASDTSVKAISEICAQAKFTDVTKNFLEWLAIMELDPWMLTPARQLVVLAENGRLRHVDSIAKRFSELTMAHRGELKAIVTTVIPLPAEEEKELKQTLSDILGQGKKIKLEQRIDPSILGGLVVEFGQKVFDMSIKTRARQMERFLREPINI
ncbi:hypothetical protein Cgig2_007213 [Carnegiea gigantea]|uniref:ATP synthase subunit O, mitochondrial n=1 Tax=Carnegiea gigantea TaxID=171969 RepID=A0A9Q1KXJ6_9CARY|nr:hypothetical protein Cgig2_007213 [Carnegiea gigantea]